MKRKYGLLPQKEDVRDRVFKASGPVPANLEIDLRPFCPPVYDQKDLGSCTANAWAGIYEFLLMKENHFVFRPSRLYIYYYERVLNNSVDQDSGAALRDGIKVLSQRGTCSEKAWPYLTKAFKIKPPFWCDKSADTHKALQYEYVPQTENSIKAALLKGIPVAIGISIFESFESKEVAMAGQVPMPKVRKEEFLGGHAVMLVGCSDSKKEWIVRNSWGPEWGDKGYFYLPYEYLLDRQLASDFWAADFVQ